MTRGQRRFWRYLRGLAAPILLWGLFVYVLTDTLRARLHGDEEYDRDALKEWIEESRVFRDTLPEMVKEYIQAADPERKRLEQMQIREQLETLGNPTKMYQGQMILFPSLYRLELVFPNDQALPPIVWESGVPRTGLSNQVRRLDHPLLGGQALLRMEYQLHAYNKRQQIEQAANLRLRWMSVLAVAATALAVLWIILVQRRERERERQRLLAQQQIGQAERLLLTEELRRQEAERRHEEAERRLLEQRLATQAAERQALELKSQLYASIGIMAGSYAHNIKNLLVRPNDLLRRCLEGDGLSPDHDYMLREVRQTLGTVTERLQQILQTVRRDPNRSELAPIDLNALVKDIRRTWEDLARDKWKLVLNVELDPEPLWIKGDASHLQQAVENLLFNARDATFEMRNTLRDQVRSGIDAPGAPAGPPPPSERGDRGGERRTSLREALIAAAGWRGTACLRTRRLPGRAVLEVGDNGIGMTEEVRRCCTETHFSTKRDNAIYEGHSTGMGLGLSFVVVVLENHQAKLEIESEPMKGTLFRMNFPVE